jgi:hypothetical protein
MEPTTPTTTRFPLLAGAGVLAMAAGIAWDAVLHAHDPGLAAREGPFTLSNPGHLLLTIGMALASIGVLGTLRAVCAGRAHWIAVVAAVLAVATGAAAVGMRTSTSTRRRWTMATRSTRLPPASSRTATRTRFSRA